MEKQHLTYFKIENFKRFDSFEMDNLGQFNLIVGDNNVGKTSVLEALTFDDDARKILTNFWGVTAFRGTYQFQKTRLEPDDIQQTRFWESIFRNLNSAIKIKNSDSPFDIFIELRPHLKLSEEEKILINNAIITIIPTYWIKVSFIGEDGNLIDYQLIPAYMEGASTNNKDNFISSYIPFIPANIGYKSDLLNLYYLFVNPDKKNRKETEDNLRKFIPNLEEIRPHKISPEQEVIGVTLLNSDIILPLTYFGDGTVKYFRFLLEIFISRNRRLMVDEIGSGIHFSRLKLYWKSVLQLCKQFKVQLFATTHSLECQRAFVDALEDPEMQQYQKDARNITLLENKQGEVKAVTYDFEQFEYALNIGFNTRGGVL
ncbi:AAA family ATPase [Spirosoma aerolatum]|uniref:AAA family ATPase n=1 Tax=Spirosoma aerolatum TaxID=1211326 RepID=UPI0009AE1B1F|nr:AAA family ATPase [Spirosoma aerolatum]